MIYLGSIEQATRRNNAFRRVIATGRKMQLVVMTLKLGEEIGEEVHARTDQFIRIESGKAIIVIQGNRRRAGPGDAVLIPAGTLHNVINVGRIPLRLYTLYAPPEHPAHMVEQSSPRKRERF